MAGRRAALVGLVLLLLLAAAVRLVQIDRPGPYSDELIFSNAAKRFLEQRPLPGIPGASWGGVWLPLGFSGHTGPLTLYIEAGARLLTGGAPFLYRYLNVVYALLAVVLGYLLAAREWGRASGLLLAAILALLPSFVFYSRVGNHVIFFRTLIGVAFFLLLLAWLRTRDPRRAVWLALVTGIGLSTRLEAVWLVAGFLGVLAFDAEARRATFDLLRRPGRLALAAGAFAMGGAFFIANNAVTLFAPVAHVRNNLAVTLYGHDNRRLLANLATRLDHLRSFVAGTDFPEYGAVFANPVWPLLLAVSVAFAAVAAVRARAEPTGIMARRLLAFSLPVLLISTFSVSSIRTMHLLIVFFLPFLFILLTLHGLARRPWLQRGFLAAVLAAVALDGVNTVRYHRALGRTEGTGNWSTGIYNLVRYAEQHLDGHRIRLGNWGLYQPLDFLSARRHDLAEIFGYEGGYATIPESFYLAVERELQLPGPAVFVFHTADYENGFLRRRAFEELLAARGVGVRVRQIPDRRGRPMFALYFPEAPLPSEERIEVTRLFPHQTVAGEPFNRQPDGRAAIAVGGSYVPDRDYVVVFAGRPRAGASDGRTVVTAIVERDEYARPGAYEVYVMDPHAGARSPALPFTVLPAGVPGGGAR